MKVRCKMKLATVLDYGHGTKEYTFQPEYDTTIPEDKRFCQYSPSGKFVITVTNPSVHEHYKVGSFYYFDSTPVEAV